jgi:hypothetical protein
VLGLHCELVPKKLADPCVLQDYGQALIEKVLETEVIYPDDKRPRLEVGPPMGHYLDKPDQLHLVGGKLCVVWHNGAAEEDKWPTLLMQDNVES